MNTYIQQMKNVLNNYYKAVQTTAGKIREARRVYLPPEAQIQVDRFNAQLAKDRDAAKAAITEARDKGIAEVEAWTRLDGSKITEDAKLLKFDLDQKQFDDLVSRYKSNGTMCYLLGQYAAEHNAQLAKEHPGEFNPKGYLNRMIIPPAENKIKAYEVFYSSAMSTIGSMEGPGFGEGPASPMVKASVEMFGEAGALSAPYLAVLE
jgi:hypothetical protein